MRRLLIAVVCLAACDDDGAKSGGSDLSQVLPAQDLSQPGPDMAEPAVEADLAGPEVFSTGTVDVLGYGYTVGASHFSGSGATASFTTTTYQVGLNCAISTVSGCRVQNCNGNLFAATQTDDSVGTFTFSVSGNTYTFTPDGTNNYTYAPHSPAPSPSPGATVTVYLPGVSPVPVVEPAVTTLVSPSPAPATAVAVSQGSDFSVYFSGGTAGSQATVSLSGQTSTQSVLVTCTGDPSTGKVTAPKAALQSIPQGSGALSVRVAGVAAPVQIMGHTTTVTASTVVVDPSGNVTGGFTTTVGP